MAQVNAHGKKTMVPEGKGNFHDSKVHGAIMASYYKLSFINIAPFTNVFVISRDEDIL